MQLIVGLSRSRRVAVIALGLLYAVGAGGLPRSMPTAHGAPAQTGYGPTVRAAAGPDGSALQAAVGAFKADLGGDNNGVGGSFAGGRREINWDGVPDQFSAPNALPPDFFNVNSPRGAVFSTAGSGFQVSANEGVAPVRFDTVDPSYSGLFHTFSPQRLFTARDTTVYDVHFFVPGTATPATVRGFGAVFANVRIAGAASIEYIDSNGYSLGVWTAEPDGGNGLAFLGVSWDDGTRVATVRITTGTVPLAGGVTDYGDVNLVVNDDFFYAEPQAN